MPIYEYQCQACGDVQEMMQKVSDPAPTACPVCHKGPIQKLMSKTAFILKGEGWYVTDFRDKSKPKDGAKGESKKDAAPASGDQAASPSPEPAKSPEKSDSKPAESSAPKASPAPSTSST